MRGNKEGFEMIGNHVPTPDWLRPLVAHLFDPYPLNGNGPIEPPKGVPVWANPGFDRWDEEIENAIRWHKEGRWVACLIPMESSTKRGKRLRQYGYENLTFDHRPFPEARNVEIIILTGKPKK